MWLLYINAMCMCWKKKNKNAPDRHIHKLIKSQHSGTSYSNTSEAFTQTQAQPHTRIPSSMLSLCETDNSNVLKCSFCLVHNNRPAVEAYSLSFLCVAIVQRQASCMQTFAMLERWFLVSVVSINFLFVFNSNFYSMCTM